MKNLKKITSVLLILILSLSLFGCEEEASSNIKSDAPVSAHIEKEENSKEESPEEIKEDEDKSEKEEEISEVKEEKDESQDIENKTVESTLYYNSKEYIETGNEELDKFIPVKKELKVVDGKLAEAIVLALYEEPDNEDLSTAIREENQFIGVNLKDGIAYVNFKSEGMNGGSLQEFLFIGQIVNSLLEVENIKGVQFMLDGEIASDLMGHLITEEPFTEKIE